MERQDTSLMRLRTEKETRPGIKPRFTSGKENEQSSPAKTTSARARSDAPPPEVCPLHSTMIGRFEQNRNCVKVA